MKHEHEKLNAQDFDRRIDYLRILGDYHLKLAEMMAVEATYFATEPLNHKHVVFRNGAVESKARYNGLRDQLVDMKKALEELEGYATSTVSHLTKIWSTQRNFESSPYKIRSMNVMAFCVGKIVAPKRGRIIQRVANEGETIQFGQPLFKYVPIETVVVAVYLPQSELISFLRELDCH